MALAVSAAVMATLAAAGGYWYVASLQAVPLSTDGESARFAVRPGDSLANVAERLAERGIIREPLRLRLYGRLSGRADQLQAGAYRLTSEMDVDAMLTRMARGDVITYRLTVVEGWRFDQMLSAIQDHDAIAPKIADLDAETIMARIGANGEHPEGRFLPQTYQFRRGTSDKAVLKRAYQAMERTLSDAWGQRQEQLPLDSPYEALILASIIEKETAVPSERRQIAGVFVRRLRRGMRLQTDPTVIYGMGEDYDGNIRRSDLRRDTPYNTYRRAGLPPTPIALPGEASIRAAVNPADGSALYFVSKGDQGEGHYFSDTLQEHNQAVQRYQRN